MGKLLHESFFHGILGFLILVFQCNFCSDPGVSSKVLAKFIDVCTDEEEFAAVC